jgi:hypothetical protein
MTAILLFLKGVPLWVWAVIALVAGGWLYGNYRYHAGEDARQAQWDAAVERGKKEVARLTEAAGKVTVRVETKTVEKIVHIQGKARVIEKVREVFVPTDSGSLPGGFRLFYNAAIEGSVPDTASITDAAPVPIADVADTHAANTEKCHIAYATVAGWQEWASEQAKLNPPER